MHRRLCRPDHNISAGRYVGARNDLFVNLQDERKARADAERRAIQRMLDGLPSIDDPTPHDGGMSQLGPVAKEKYAPND